MKINFELLSIRNFKSISHIDLKLDRVAGLHFVRGENLSEPRLGSNGAGKTSLFDALTWCLCGKTASGLRNTDIKPWLGGTPSVALVGKRDDDRFTILRTANPNTISKDGEPLGQDDIDKFLGLNFDLFTNTILLAQGQPLFFDLPPREKMQLFTDVLDLDKWDQRSAQASEKTNEIFRKVNDAQATVDSLKGELTTVSEMLEKYRQRSIEWKAEREEKLKVAQKELEEYSNKLTSVQSKYDTASVEYDGAMTEIKMLRESNKDVVNHLRETERAYDKAANTFTQAGVEIKRLEKQLVALEKSQVCPTCGQAVEQKDFDKHRKEIHNQLDELDVIEKAGIPDEVKKAYTDAKAAYDLTLKAEKAFEDKAVEWRQAMDHFGPELARTQAQVDNLTKSIAEFEKASNPYREQTDDLETRKQVLEEDIATGDQYVNKMRSKAERVKFWVKGFKDIRLFIIEDVLEELGLASSIIMEELGLIGWNIKYSIERETKSGTMQRGINVVIESPSNESSVKWESWSGGEGQRLRIVGALALSEVLLSYAGIQTNLEILDEPTRHLSSQGVKDTWTYLAERAERLNRVCMYIDHQSVESARFASVITAVKDEAGTHIEEG